MLVSKPWVLFQNYENTAVISLCIYTSIGFEFVKEKKHVLYT